MRPTLAIDHYSRPNHYKRKRTKRELQSRACPQLGKESAQYWNRQIARGESILRCRRCGCFFRGLNYPTDVGRDSWRSAAGELTGCAVMRFATTNGIGSRIFCPDVTVMSGGPPKTIGCLSMP